MVGDVTRDEKIKLTSSLFSIGQGFPVIYWVAFLVKNHNIFKMCTIHGPLDRLLFGIPSVIDLTEEPGSNVKYIDYMSFQPVATKEEEKISKQRAFDVTSYYLKFCPSCLDDLEKFDPVNIKWFKDQFFGVDRIFTCEKCNSIMYGKNRILCEEDALDEECSIIEPPKESKSKKTNSQNFQAVLVEYEEQERIEREKIYGDIYLIE